MGVSTYSGIGQYPLGFWPDWNRDPAVGSTTFDHFCATLSGDTPKDGTRMVHLPGGLNVNVALLDHAKCIREVCAFIARGYVSSTILFTSENNRMPYRSAFRKQV